MSVIAMISLKQNFECVLTILQNNVYSGSKISPANGSMSEMEQKIPTTNVQALICSLNYRKRFTNRGDQLKVYTKECKKVDHKVGEKKRIND